MRILVTGGTGFIGSHTCIELINAGYDVVIADNLYNSKALVVDRIEELAGKRPVFYEVDVTDKAAMNELFDKVHHMEKGRIVEK
jgi:UDP-glucose 4-epimerase